MTPTDSWGTRPRPITGTESDALARRAAALAIDLIVVTAITAAIGSAVTGVVSAVVAATGVAPPGAAGPNDAVGVIGVGAALGALVAVPAAIGYFAGLEWLAGQTIGKFATGVVVVRADGGPLTLRAALVRNLLRPVDAFPAAYLLGAASVVATGRRQRLGDLAAGTVVVRGAPTAADVDAAPPSASAGA